MELHFLGEQVALQRPLLDVVRQQHDGVYAFAQHLMRDLRHGQRAIDRLAAGHRHRIVVEDLVGDVDAGRDRLADRQRAAVEIGAIAQVLEHVLGIGERGLPGPGDAFATHVGEGVGIAVHPRHHVMAADAGQCPRALRHHRRGVVRAAAAVMRHAREVGARQGKLAFLVFHPRQHVADPLAVMEALDAPGDHAGDACWRQFVGGRQDPLAGFVVLADYAGTLAVEVVEQLLHLALDEAVLLLHHQDVAQATRERTDAGRFQWPGHADLVDADADVATGRIIKPQVLQRLQHVEVALAGGDDAEACIRAVDHRLVDAVGACEGLRRFHRIAMQAHLLLQRRVWPADVEAAFGHFEVIVAGQDDVLRQRIDVHRGRGFHRFGNRLEADPAPGKA